MNMMVIFDVIVVLFGVYMVASAFKMNRSGEISSMLVSKEELGKCRDKAAFIGSIYRKEAAFGVIMALVGILNLVDALSFPSNTPRLRKCWYFYLHFCGLTVNYEMPERIISIKNQKIITHSSHYIVTLLP